MTSVFAKYQAKAYPYKFQGRIRVDHLCGGVPTDPKVAEGWLRTKLADKDDLIRQQVADTMVERGITAAQATEEVDLLRHLNGFKREPLDIDRSQLYIEGRQLKAAIKEAGSVAVAADKLKRKWGATNKGIKSFLAEHVFVVEDRLPLFNAQGDPIVEADEVNQRFVHTFRGAGIQYEELVHDCDLSFTVITDQKLSEEEWGMLWLTGEQEGIGATRSQGFGRYTMTAWDAE